MVSLEDAIRRRAYELWEAHGCPENRSDEFWFMAEKEVTAMDAPVADDAKPAARKSNVRKRASRSTDSAAASATAPKKRTAKAKAGDTSTATSAKTRGKSGGATSKKASAAGSKPRKPAAKTASKAEASTRPAATGDA